MPERTEARSLSRHEREDLVDQLREEFEVPAALAGARFSARVLAGGSPSETVVAESSGGQYDLLLLGAEDKLLGSPLFYGQGTAEIMERAGCTTAVVIPRLE